MSDKMKRNWITVNESMSDAFRESVVEIALAQYPGAPKKLKDVARTLFSAIKTPGFRSFDRAPIGLVKPHVVEMMQRVSIAADTVICLWAEAQASLLDELRKAAADAGLDIEPSWEWYHGIDGYHALESMEVFAQVVSRLASERSEDERNGLHLAALWLSGAVVAERADQGEAEGWSTETELVDSPNSDMASIEDPLEPVLPSNPNETNSEQPESEEDSIMTSDSITDEPDTVHATEHEDQIDSAQSDGDSASAVQITRSVGFAEYETASLERLRAEMLTRMEVHAEYRDTLTGNLRRLLNLVEDGAAREVADESNPLADLFSKWTSAAKDLIEFALYCAQRLTSELAARPDIDDHDISLQFLTDFVSTMDLNAGRPGIARIGELMEQISKYDQQRQAVWEAIDTLRTHMGELLEQIRHWVTEEPIDLARYDNEQTQLTRSELDTLLSEALTNETQLLAQLEQLRELSKNRVENLATTLIQYDVPTETQVVAGRVLADITSFRIEIISDMELRALELALSERVSEETARARHVKFADLAGDLRDYWDDQVFLDVLRGLADNGRNAESFLLLVSANMAHPRSVLLNLEPSVVESLFRGIGQFSDKSQPFELANLLAPELMNGWSAQDPVAQARLCLVFLAAHFSGKSRLPDGFLWNLPNEWPITEMSTWNRLWQMVLLDDSLPVITDYETADVELRLAEAQEEVDRVFEHDGRMYVILKSYRSRRHMALMNGLLLPELQARTKSLEDIETETRQKAERYPDQIKHLVESLRNSIVDLEKTFSEETLLEKYEESIVAEGIDDSHPFHRRIAHKTLQEISEVLAQYCSALIEYWESRVLPTATVSRRLLEEELKYIPNPTPLEKPVLDQLTFRKQVNPSPRDASKASDESSRLLVEQLLGVAEHSQRLPRLICLLTANEFAWNDLVDPILQDLSTPLSVTEVASLLLEHEAVSQVLLLAKYGLPVDQQKHAQQALDRMQREVSDLQRELLKTGGTVDDLEHDRQLGRWRFVRQRLSKRLDSQRDRQRAAKQRVEIQARQLRNRINDLDEKMFEIRDLMPPTAYDLVAKGMNLARQATRKEELFGVAEDFLSELSYRYDHDSWPLTDLQETVTRLSDAVTGQTRIREGQLALNDILGMFESNELRPLGLDTTLVSPSEIGTRADLIRNWIAVGSIKEFYGDNMTLAERGVVQAVYRSFAQMTVMRYSRTPDNKPIAYEYPVVYSLYDLQHPKTPVLEKPCVLLTLPGTPPSPRHLQELGYLIDERKWLDDAFVILFAPGCTPKIRDRLLQEYHDAGLVVIDEFAMRELVLANADSRTPLGRFRSMLLNSLGAADIDICTAPLNLDT